MTSLLAWRPWLVAAIAAVMFLTNLGGSRLWNEDEPKNARCGVEMHERGDWVVPTYNDELRSHKPVLLYWAMRASYAAFGVSEFSARLPSALCGIAIVVMCYHLGRLLFDRTIGLLAAVLLTSAVMFATLSRAATPDGVLMIATTAALLAFVAGVAKRRGGAFSGDGDTLAPLASLRLPWPHTVVMYAAMGVAVLAKGPIGVLLPLWAICLYGLFGEPAKAESGKRKAEGLSQPVACVSFRFPLSAFRFREAFAWFFASIAPRRWWDGARSIRMGVGLLIVAAMAGPWYVAVSLQTGGDWLAGFLGTHNVGRFAGAMEGHDGRPFYALYYVVTLLALFFPPSCFLPVAMVAASRERGRRSSLAPSYAFGLAVVAAWVGFFSLAATKLPNYIIPCYVGLAVVTAAWLIEQTRRTHAVRETTVRSWLGAGMASCAVSGVVVAVALAIIGGVLMGGTPWIGLAGLAPLVGGLLGLLFLRQGNAERAVAAFTVAGLAFTFGAQTIVGAVASPYADAPRLADAVLRLEQAGGPLRVATHRYTMPSVVWELDRHVPSLDEEAAVEHFSNFDAVAFMDRGAYERIKPRLGPSVEVLADEGRFLRLDRRVVLVGHRDLLARTPSETIVR